MNILLQILDDGKIADAHGRTVNFENTVIIMTSNAGSEKKGGELGFAKTELQLSQQKAKKALSEFLRPEFLSRLDEIVVFNSLCEQDFAQIAKLMLEEYVTALKERKIEFKYTEEAALWLAKQAIGGKSGARDLRNLIRKKVEDKITDILIESQEAPSKITLKGEAKLVATKLQKTRVKI
jgi:ATP-dependent Clp protease ATP-binding subunit ClpA